MSKCWFVYTLLDPTDGRVRFIGMGRSTQGEHPAATLWRERFRADEDSPVTRWLKTFREPPPRGVVGTPDGMSRDAAMELFTANRQKLKADGVALLSTRPAGTWKTGYGEPRPCIDENGDFHVSVRAAARDRGVDPGTIVRRIQSGVWRYAP